MKLTFLLTATLVASSSLMATSIFGETHKGCAPTKQEALYTLSGNIQSRISTYIEKTVVVSGDDNVKSKVSDYTSSATNLSLVNIEYTKEGENICAVVHKDDQVSNTNKLLKQALLYDVKNLPTDTDAKIEKLSTWISNIKQLSFLIPAFLNEKNTDKEQAILNKKEKIFTDLYTDTIAYSDSLFFKSCKSTAEKAKIALNKELFLNGQKDEKKGFLDSITSIFSSDDSTKMLDIFDAQIVEVKKDGDVCLMIKKEELLQITQKMYADAMRISEKSLSKDPVKRYKNIQDNLYEQLDVTKALIKLFPDVYKSNNFNQLNEKRKLLVDIQAKTYPQYVEFHVNGAENIVIMLDNKKVENNKKYFIKDGDHSYKITAKGKCPLSDTFDVDLFENETVSQDLEGQTYPTVIFLTDKEPNIVINGQIIKANMAETIKQCKGEARYVVKYAGQNISGEVDTSPGEKNTVTLDFMTSQELAVFNDAKTKKFTTTSEARFSESLTAIASDNFEFSVTRKPMHGSVTLHERGSFQYVSEKDFVGIDSFEYEIQTPQKTSAPKLVTITVGKSLIPKKVKKIIKEAVAPVVAKVLDKNVTAEKTVEKKEKSVEKRSDTEVNLDEIGTVAEEKYQKWKKVVMSQDIGNVNFLKMLQKKYPAEFERLRKEMTHK